VKVERSKEWWLAKARQETGAVSAGGHTTGCCSVCFGLFTLYHDGRVPIHAVKAGPACEGSQRPPEPQCSQCGQYQHNHDRHGSPGCPGVYATSDLTNTSVGVFDEASSLDVMGRR